MQKSTRASTASKKVATAKAQRRSTTIKPAQMLNMGDVVRLPMRNHNQFTGYDPRMLREDVPSRQVEGIILSIREISSGRLVPLASGDTNQYVIEVLHSRSFEPAFASTANAGKATMADRSRNSQLMQKIQGILKQMATERKLVSMTDGTLSSTPALSNLLDGWRVVKVRAEQLEVPE